MIYLRSTTLLCSVAMSMLVVLIIMGLAKLSIDSNIGDDQNDIRDTLNNINQPSEGLKVLNHKLLKTFIGNWVVKGQIINKGTREIPYAIINIDFFDKSGNLLYSGPVTINDIKPGEKKGFEVNYYGPKDKLNSYKITSEITV